VADRDDVVRIARSLPEVVVEGDGDRYALCVPRGGKHKGIAWTWMERVEPGRPRVPNPAVLAVRVENASEKEMLLAAGPDVFFTEPHYNGFPAVLVRLAAIGADELAELITDGWRCQAPRALVREFDRRRDA
jgi:hypothetical protein